MKRINFIILLLMLSTASFQANAGDPVTDKNTKAAQTVTPIRSKINASAATEITYQKIGPHAVITTSYRSLRNDDFFSYYIMDNIPIVNFNTVIIPNDGKAYWYVKFDPSDPNPVAYMVAGTSVVIDCVCSSNGTCSTKRNSNCFHCCNETCNGDCTMTSKKSGIIIQATSVYYNGTHYVQQ